MHIDETNAIEQIESGLLDFMAQVADLEPALASGLYDPQLRVTYYATSDFRRELGSRVGALRFYGANGSSKRLLEIDKQLSRTMSAIQERYLLYLRTHQRKIFSS